MNLSLTISGQLIKRNLIKIMASPGGRMRKPRSNHYGKPQYTIHKQNLFDDNIDGGDAIDCGVNGDEAIQHTVAKVGLGTTKSIMHASRGELCAWVLHVGILIYGKINQQKEYRLIGGPQLGLWALMSSKERPTDGKYYIPVQLSMAIEDYVEDPQAQFHGFFLFGAEDTFAPKCFGE